MWNRLGVVVIATVLLTSCASKKKVSTPIVTNKTEVVKPNNERFLINNLDFRTFSGRAKTKVEFGNEKQDATLHIRLDKDKAIWISVTATVFNYEAARVLITPDSIKVLNKLQSEYISKPFSYVHRYTGKGVTFSMLQDLLLANVSSVLLKTDQLTVASAIDESQLVGVKDNLGFQYSLNMDNRPKVFRLNIVGSSENIEAFYGSFNKVTGYNFPQNQNIKLNAQGMKVSALLDYNKFEFNEPVEMPFSIPSKYKQVN